MLNNNTLISVIMPLYNAENFVNETIHSILNQTYRNFELIIINDGSTDASLEKVRKIKDERLKLYDFTLNQGVTFCRNFGIEAAVGDYVSFCDSDDIWLKDKLEKQLFYMKKYDLKISGTRVKNFRNEITEAYDRPFKAKVKLRDMLVINTLVMSSVMISRKILLETKFSYVRHEDFDMWIRLLKSKIDVIYSLDEVLVLCRRHGRALTSNKFKMLWWRYLVLRSNQYNNFQCISLIFLRLFYGR